MGFVKQNEINNSIPNLAPSPLSEQKCTTGHKACAQENRAEVEKTTKKKHRTGSTGVEPV